MKEKLAVVMYECYQNGVNRKQVPRGYYADKILDIISQNIQVPVKCPAKCYHGIVYYGSNNEDWEQEPCVRCHGTGETTRPATPEEMEIGGILRRE